MFLIDNLLLLPLTGTLHLARTIESAAREATAKSADGLRAELTELYRMLETGGITSDEFDAREARLLDRLDAIEAPQRESETPVNKP
ncbi:MAG: gas vesicle protein GvpG [Candidatus Brocadiia bacterium]|jgi:hypothetical protein